MPDEDNVIDVEAEEFVESDNLPAVIEKPWSGAGLEGDTVTRKSGQTYEAKPGRTADGLSLDAALVARHDAALANNPERRCVAKTPKGQCRKFAILGSTVCRTHGGATEHVTNKARVRVQMAGNRLMGKLIEFAFDDTNPPDTQLRAIRDALDRAGLRPPAEVVLSQGEPKPWEELFEGIGTASRAESRRARGVPDSDDSFAGFASGTEDSESLPPTQQDPDLPTGPADTPTGGNLLDSADFGGDSTDYGDLRPEYVDRNDGSSSYQERSDPSVNSVAREPRPPANASDRRAQRPQRHVTGDAARIEANRANREIGALKAIESPHKRYRRP